MSPMTRCFSPAGIPGPEVAQYYQRRAEGGVGLIVTEGTWIPIASASNESNVPNFYGEEALTGWARVLRGVHSAGARIFPQLWHVGQIAKPDINGVYAKSEQMMGQLGPSGIVGGMGILPAQIASPATLSEIDKVIDAYALAAESAQRLGFDGVELHGAHGYLIDQFLWSSTNRRTDRYGGGIASRAQFAADIIREVRRRTGVNFPISLRISQWKLHDYAARIVETPQELAALLTPLADAGVDIIHCSQRRFWEGEFGSDRNLAGWVKTLSGLPTITVGSVSLRQDVMSSLAGEPSQTADIDRLLDLIERGDFDMVAVGRALLTDPCWTEKIRRGALEELLPFDPASLTTLT